MGKFKGKRRKNKSTNDKEPAKDSVKQSGGGGDKNYVNVVIEKGNSKMEAYYAAQGLHHTRWSQTETETTPTATATLLKPCTTYEEFETERLLWRTAATAILPASFRFAKDIPSTLREKCEAEMNALLETAGQQLDMPVVRQLQFLPHAYQLGVDRALIRKDPHLKAFFEWVKHQNLAGFITRQETVSMVPPVVLNPQPADCILDMCAAPGSKTSQILECLGTEGSLIANDNNAKRAQ